MRRSDFFVASGPASDFDGVRDGVGVIAAEARFR